ncbi:hypothetical protein [Delftia sp. PS-11]|uniref:hypothetical protein n=1 Tax=Delftia sp. PS-11 TaxID=2767222 RepID=UPI002458E341|nr:hypothetical protein [Delftia sp. PS-11]KAJ8740890.1 hypothetical protein H9T68_22285 [Delftia sp. PS-11]
MNDFAATLTRWTVRIALMLIGLVFFVSLLTVAALLALLWGARALWAKLTGQPVMPWSMRMSPRAGWQTVYRSGSEWMAQRPQRAQGGGDGAGSRRAGVLPGGGDVVDVQPREVREP